ncbi:unnamed protein product [Caretta caretta]
MVIDFSGMAKGKGTFRASPEDGNAWGGRYRIGEKTQLPQILERERDEKKPGALDPNEEHREMLLAPMERMCGSSLKTSEQGRCLVLLLEDVMVGQELEDTKPLHRRQLQARVGGSLSQWKVVWEEMGPP